jgi:hypothetical protein
MAISSKKTRPKFIKDVWRTAGISLSLYLLERLPQAGLRISQSDEEVFSCTLKKVGNPDTLLHV